MLSLFTDFRARDRTKEVEVEITPDRKNGRLKDINTTGYSGIHIDLFDGRSLYLSGSARIIPIDTFPSSDFLCR